MTVEGRQVWGLVLRLGGQIRVASGMSIRCIGWDLGAAFALGDALGISRTAMAVFLPDLEQVVMRQLNERAEASERTG